MDGPLKVPGIAKLQRLPKPKEKQFKKLKVLQPPILASGKRFHKLVQEHWQKTNKSGEFLKEKVLKNDSKIHSLSRGRMDILITDMDDMVAILEIKNTFWDKILSKNIKRNLNRHQSQIYNYINEYINCNISVCPGIIYPKRPSKELTSYIEQYHEDNGIVVVWFEDENVDH